MAGGRIKKLRKDVQNVADLVTTTATEAVHEVRDLAVESAVEIRDAAVSSTQDVRGTLPSLEEIISQAALLPGVRVERAEFLVNALSKYPIPTVRMAVDTSPVQAGITIASINRIAGKALGKEARRTTVASAVAGLPGGVAAAASIPADLLQLYGHLIRAIQMLSYLYGWRDTCALSEEESEINPATRRALVLFLGAMAGYEQADAEMQRLAPLRATDGVAEALLESEAVDAVAADLEARFVHRMTGQVVGKSIPLAGFVISGAISYGGFSDMWKRLRKTLAGIG